MIFKFKQATTSPRQIVIGDVHGHYDALVDLLKKIALKEDDSVYFLGDLIDRGPKSAQVVQFVIDNHYQCLRGNHEEMLLDAVGSDQVCPEVFQAWLYSGGSATIASYGKHIPQEHLDWMAALPTYLDLGTVWLAHAGVHPHIPIEEQTSEQFCWVRDDFHGMTQPYFADKLIVTGHTITFTLPGVKPGQIAAGPGWLDIETGAYHRRSGWLTALDVTEEMVYQINTLAGTFRKLPLKKAIAHVEPASIASRRSRER